MENLVLLYFVSVHFFIMSAGRGTVAGGAAEGAGVSPREHTRRAGSQV